MAELKILHSNLMAYTAKQALADVYPGERPTSSTAQATPVSSAMHRCGAAIT